MQRDLLVFILSLLSHYNNLPENIALETAMLVFDTWGWFVLAGGRKMLRRGYSTASLYLCGVQSGGIMDIGEDKIDDTALALLYLTLHEKSRVWCHKSEHKNILRISSKRIN